MIVQISARSPVFAFRRDLEPVARVAPGDELVVETIDIAYRGLTGAAIDRGDISLSRTNALTGPIWIEGAEPGDAVGLSIEGIELSDQAHVVYVARWRRATFGLPDSRTTTVPIRGEQVELPGGGRIQVRPMIGCIGVAPASGSVSALSPCAPTGGNLDLVELAPAATIWFPCRVPGALLALGDLHARMGRGEPVGCGLECAGAVRGTVRLATRQPIDGPVIVTPDHIAFVGSHADDPYAAQRVAVARAWSWLRKSQDMPDDAALTMAAAMLEVDFGGPAGANVVAKWSLDGLHSAGVALSGWPFAMIP